MTKVSLPLRLVGLAIFSAYSSREIIVVISLSFCLEGYKHLFQPVINQVVEFYQPTCIVLQVRIFDGCSLWSYEGTHGGLQ